MDSISYKTRIKSVCESCEHQKQFVFRHLNAEQLLCLSNEMNLAHYNPGEFIFKQGTSPLGFMCLKKGNVKIVRPATNGNELIIDLKSSPDTLGIRALSTGAKYKSSAIALDHVSICSIHEKAFYNLLDSCPKVIKELLSYIGDRLVKADERLISMTQKHIKSRLADTLLHLQDTIGDDADGYLNILLKRCELAQLSNMTTSNVIRVLSEFRSKGLIELNNRKIKIVNKEALNQISEFDKC